MRPCELFFHLGEKLALDGQGSQARESLQKALDTRVVEFNEYGFASGSLARLPR